MRVLASGQPPQPPPAFDPASLPDATFDPPLRKEGPRKVLKTGLAPCAPPTFSREEKPGEFDPPLKAAQEVRAPKRVFVSVPKVLASGHVPQPPPAFVPAGFSSGDFDPPVTFEPVDITRSGEDAGGAAASDGAPAVPKGYKIKRKRE